MQNAHMRVQAPSAPGFKGFRRFRGKVLKMDRPAAGGFLSLTGPLAPRVADCRSAAMLIKSALRDWLSASYGMISITSISHLRWLPPLWWLAPPPFPRKRGHYKAPLCCERLMKGQLFRALLSHHTVGGRWCRKAPKGGKPPKVADHHNAYFAI